MFYIPPEIITRPFPRRCIPWIFFFFTFSLCFSSKFQKEYREKNKSPVLWWRSRRLRSARRSELLVIPLWKRDTRSFDTFLTWAYLLSWFLSSLLVVLRMVLLDGGTRVIPYSNCLLQLLVVHTGTEIALVWVVVFSSEIPGILITDATIIKVRECSRAELPVETRWISGFMSILLNCTPDARYWIAIIRKFVFVPVQQVPHGYSGISWTVHRIARRFSCANFHPPSVSTWTISLI